MQFWRLIAGNPGLGPPMEGGYDPILVALSVLVASLAGFAALSVVDRIITSRRRSAARRWLVVGAAAMGGGIWAMHFTGMLAFSMEGVVRYDLWGTLASILPGLLGSGAALYFMARRSTSWKRVQLGALLMATGIGGMHYLGMEAMRMSAILRYDAWLFLGSIVVAHALATCALYVRFMVGSSVDAASVWAKIAASGLIGLTVAGMHYTAMVAARFYPGGSPPESGLTFAPKAMGVTIFGIAVLITLCAVVAVAVNRRLERADQTIRRVAARERSILETMVDAVILVDAHGVIEDVNPACERMFGAAEDDLIGRGVARLLPGAVGPDGEGLCCDATDGAVETTAHRRSNGQFPAELTISSFTVEQRPCFVLLVRDVTERKEFERQLKEALQRADEMAAEASAANEAKSAFLANMSHEIRTPLTSILGYAELLNEGAESDVAAEQRAQSAQTIQRAGRHLLTLINDILDLSKIEADRLEIDTAECSLAGVLAEVDSLVRPRATEKGLAFTVSLDGPAPDQIMTDPTRLRQMLMNLASNAVKFTDGGSISIIVSTVDRDDGPRLRIAVEDTGPGIPPDKAGQLFAPFVQADAGVTRVHGGTGLGLAISRRLARLMGGEVSLEWTECGRGTRFCIDLPLKPAPGAALMRDLQASAAPVERTEQPDVALEGRILLAEDGRDNQRLIRHHLTQAGAEVDVADHGKAALERIEQAEKDGRPYDLLVTDIQMPEMDGHTVARTLRRRGSTLPIVALTAHAMAEDCQECLDAGCDDYASKPIDRATLLRTCERWLSGAGRAEAA